MRKLESDLKNRKVDINKLLNYGFIKEKNQYIFKDRMFNDQFEVIVWIIDDVMYSKVIDIENDDEYILVDIQNFNGEFVGKVRKEYENKLIDIIEKCTISEIYKNKQSKEIIEYINNKYNDKLEFLWEKFDDNAIWRNKENNKWYGALLKVSGKKLGIDSDEIVEIIDLRYQKENIINIIDNKKVFKGYHMNKNNWITIILDESMKIKDILDLIDNSYKLSLKK